MCNDHIPCVALGIETHFLIWFTSLRFDSVMISIQCWFIWINQVQYINFSQWKKSGTSRAWTWICLTKPFLSNSSYIWLFDCSWKHICSKIVKGRYLEKGWLCWNSFRIMSFLFLFLVLAYSFSYFIGAQIDSLMWHF